MPTRLATRDNEIDGAPEFQRKHFQRVATFVSPDGQETTKCLWLAKDMLPGQGRAKRLGRLFYLPTQTDLQSPADDNSGL